jgi:transposase
VHGLLARAAQAVAAANTVIRALLIAARVICGDETPVRAGPGPLWNKKYLHVACTRLLTCYFLGERTLASFRDFVYPALDGSVLVHDRYKNYDAFPGVRHQLCCAHLLRDLEDAAQAYPAAAWPARAAGALRALIHAANLARDRGLDQVPRLPGAKRKQPPARLLLETLRDREDDVLRFLTSTAIPPTSNQAERDLRPAKTQQKISGRLRSEQATRDRYAIRGYASTAAKHGHDTFTAIRDALTGTPWTPPAPAGT